MKNYLFGPNGLATKIVHTRYLSRWIVMGIDVVLSTLVTVLLTGLSGLSGKNLLFGRGLHIWHYWRRSLVLWHLPYYMLIVS